MKAASLIVVGTPFSGAALLGHALGAHSQAFFAGELWRKWDREADPGARECRTCGAGCETWSNSSVAAAVDNGPAAVSAALAATTGRRLVIEGPALASWLAVRLAYGEPSSEDVRIVLCVCDPLLYVRKRAGVTEECAKQRAAEWRDEQKALVRAALSSGRPLLVVRYEDLTNRMEETLARVCAFAGLEREPTLALWWEMPTHAIGAKSEAWGVAEPVHTNRGEVASGDPRQRRVETLPAFDRDQGPSLGSEVAHAVIAELRPTELYEMFGYEPVLPPYRAPRDDAERQKTAEWVKDDLRRTREAVLDNRADDAIATLRALIDHFGPAFDDLGLDAKYENLALVLVDLLNNQQRGAEALPYAVALSRHAPHNPEAQRLLAVAIASGGDASVALESLLDLDECDSRPGTPEPAMTALNLEFHGAAADPSYRQTLEGYAANPTVLIEINSRCNFHCYYCRSATSSRQKSLMSPELYEHLLRQVPEITTQALRLHIDGEPTLHPQFHEFCKMANRIGVPITLATNGSGLKPAHLDVDMAVQVHVSTSPEELSGRSKQRYAAYLDRLLRYGQEWLQSDSKQGVTYKLFTSTSQRAKPNGLTEKEAFAHALIKNIGIKDQGEWTGQGFNQTYCYRKKDGGHFQIMIMRVTEGGLYPGEEGKITSMQGLPRDFGFCDAPWKSLAVLSDGAVGFCCVDVAGQTAFTSPGEIWKRPLKEIWLHDPRINQAREAFLNGRVLLRTCRDCLSLASNREMYLFPESFAKHKPAAPPQPVDTKAPIEVHTLKAKPKAVFFTNCFGGVLRDLFSRYPGFGDKYDLLHHENFSKGPLSEEELRGTELFVYQPLDENWGWGDLSTDKLLARLPKNCRSVSLPALNFVGFWPFLANDKRNEKSEQYPFGKYFYGDGFVLDRLREGMSKEQIVAEYMTTDLNQVVDLDKLLEREIAKVRKAEAQTDVKVADFIERNFRRLRLFNTVNHPRDVLSMFLFFEVLSVLQLPIPSQPEFYNGLPKYFAEQESPIHPFIARHFGLEFINADTRYNHLGERLTFLEYIENYIDFK
jgi:organic radical activating enzyme